MDSRPRNMQLMDESIGECHRHPEAHESSGTDGAGNMGEISAFPSGRIERLFEEQNQLMIADPMIDRFGGLDRPILGTGEEAGMAGQIKKETAHEERIMNKE